MSVVAGVSRPVQAWVALTAARLAVDLGAPLLLVHADEDRVLIGRGPDGAALSAEVDPDTWAPGDDAAGLLDLPPDLRTALDELLGPGTAGWSARVELGEPSHVLTHAATEHGARLLVVGARRSGPAGWMDRLVGGSIAGRLVHTQRVPVVVVPRPEVHNR